MGILRASFGSSRTDESSFIASQTRLAEKFRFEAEKFKLEAELIKYELGMPEIAFLERLHSDPNRKAVGEGVMSPEELLRIKEHVLKTVADIKARIAYIEAVLENWE